MDQAVQVISPDLSGTSIPTPQTVTTVAGDPGTINFNADLDIRTFTVNVNVDELAPTPQWASTDPTPVTTSNPPSNTRPQFDRMKGAKWFEKAQRQDVMILGQGGIGSWLTLLISRFGCPIYTYDMDTFEAHNMTGQLVRAKDIGKLKTTAVVEICREFNDGYGGNTVYPNGIFDVNAFITPVTLCGFDNMDARKLAFRKWKEIIRENSNLPNGGGYGKILTSDFFFQDGRLTAEQFLIFNIPGDRPDLMEKYEKEWLFDEKEGYEGDCTFKQTSHAAAMVASHMAGFYTNWLTNIVTKDKNYTKLPFKYEYIIPFNLTMQDYVNT